ncbi:hypothetical protein LR013_00605 [candidate division NPL-UPA2 bacterium]|nr:hypothetical protein [candidate division NPL-UPA2 bacterium]
MGVTPVKHQKPTRPDRVRSISGSFSWIDHRFINNGFINEVTRDEILLYYFLINVGDSQGISFYRKETICKLLKLNFSDFDKARDGLILKDLLAFKRHAYDPNNGIYQVLSLPARSYSVVKERSCDEPSNPDIDLLIKSIAKKWQF